MADFKAKSIPEWQRRNSTESTDAATQDTADAAEGSEETQQLASRAKILEHAAKFLDTDEVRDRSMDRKISFLESKGLTKKEIHQLIESPNGSSKVQKAPTADALPPTQSQSNPTQKSEFSSMPTNVQIPDVPPIITYPEFLLHSQKPPPLITARRLLNTVYLVSGTAAAIYGTSQYLVSPMLESLDSARHSLFKTTSSNLNTMQKKLEGVVSTVPPSIANKLSNGVADGDDESSITSDPAELFHRDTGTQTSLPPSPSSPSSSASMLSPPVMTLSSQGQKLQNLQSHLSNFLSSGVELQTSDKTIQDELYEFRRYLEGVSFGRIHNHKEAIGKMGEKDDEIAKVKAEIRAVKGVLLSSKTFPAGGTRSRIGA